MAVATFDHTVKDLAHWEAGMSRGLEARKWGEHPESHMVRHHGRHSHGLDTCPISAGSTQTHGDKGNWLSKQKHLQCPAKQQAPCKGLWGCGTVHAQPQAHSTV